MPLQNWDPVTQVMKLRRLVLGSHSATHCNYEKIEHKHGTLVLKKYLNADIREFYYKFKEVSHT